MLGYQTSIQRIWNKFSLVDCFTPSLQLERLRSKFLQKLYAHDLLAIIGSAEKSFDFDIACSNSQALLGSTVLALKEWAPAQTSVKFPNGKIRLAW